MNKPLLLHYFANKCWALVMGMTLALNSFAQTPTTFRFSYDLGAFDITGGMVQTPSREFAIAGLNNSFGAYYGDVVKIDTAGNITWAKAYTSGFATNFTDIKNVSTGGFIVTGSSSSGGGGAVLLRLDAIGNVLWAYRYQLPNLNSGKTSNEYGNAVIETSDGGFLVGGGVDYFWDGSSASTVDTSSAMGFKVNSSGTLLWSKVWTITTANPDEHYINDVAESSDGYFFVGQSSEGSGSLNSNGDYPSNTLIVKTTTAGALTYIRRWGAGNTTSQGINAAIKLSTGNVLLGGFDDVHAFIVSVSGTGTVTPTVIFNKRLNGSAFGNTYLLQDIMENSDGNYSMIGTQLAFFSVSLNTMLGKINSTSGAWMFGRTYAPIGLSAILPEGGLCTDQGYYVSMTDQQMSGFNFNVIRTDNTGMTNDPASGCGGTSITPALGSESVTFSTPTSANYDLMTASSFSPAINNMTPTRIQHCFNTTSVLSSTSSSQNVSCNGACNGSATVTPSGGSGSYTYTWSPSGGNAATASGLCPNTYTCAIKDGAGTTVTQTVSISQPSAVSATPSQGTIACSGGTTTASVSASGGTGAYTYTWSPSGGNNASATLGAGTYTATTSDANGCTTTNTFTLTAPPATTLAVNSTPAGCGVSNGSATVTASGGTGSFTYTWSPSGGNAATASGLAAGPYTVSVTDANNCASSTSLSIITSGGPTATASQSASVTCAGLSNGTATLNISGGTPGYTVTCPSGTVSGTTINNLPAGTYTATITDQNSCVSTATVTVNEPTPIAITFTNNNPSACGASTGSVTANATGGTGVITYSWSTGASGATLTSAASGTYSVYAIDANGCSDTAAVTINAANGPTATAAETASVTCNGGATGTASVSISGGTPGFSVSWSGGAGTGSTVGNLAAGTYTATITDTNGCVTTATVTIAQPSPINITFSNNNPSQCTSPTGSVTATASGGTGVLSYSWSTGATGPSLSNVLAGTYTVTVTDSFNCSKSSQITVVNMNGPTFTSAWSHDASCHGGSDGLAAVSIGGGTPSYTLTWSNGASGDTATGLSAGVYTITAVDAAGCAGTNQITIAVNEPAAISVNINSSPAGCTNAIGSATATASGGTGPLTYSWSNSQTGNVATGLSASVYSVTVTDSNSCSVIQTVTVTVSNPPVLAVDSVQNVLCNGQSNGAAWASATGGTPTNTFTWSNSQTGTSSTGWAQGNYSVTVTDAGGCKDTAYFSISQPAPLTDTVTIVKPEHCSKQDGSATVTTTGGVINYSYQWSSGAATQTAGSLAAGTYTVIIIDANGCHDTTTATIGSVAGPTISLVRHSDVICNGQANGSATVTATGGTPALSYSWTGGITGATASALGAGSYTATVTDSAGCVSSTTVAIQQPGVLQITSTVTPVACSGGSNGSATVTASGGTSPYHLNWSGGQTGNSASGLSLGVYTITVTDTNNCQTSDMVVVTEPLPTDSSNFIGAMCVNDQSIALSAPAGSLPAYQWYLNNSPIVGATGAAFTGNTANIPNYSVSWFYNGCRYATTANYITVAQDMGTLPQTNVFTPNGDNINDTYFPFEIGSLGSAVIASQLLQTNIDNYDLTIYDRWGIQLFHTTSVTDGWDGTTGGKAVLDGTYYWLAKYKAKCSKLTGEQTIKGFVQVVR